MKIIKSIDTHQTWTTTSQLKVKIIKRELFGYWQCDCLEGKHKGLVISVHEGSFMKRTDKRTQK